MNAPYKTNNAQLSANNAAARKCYTRQQGDGFTLVELLVVIGIMVMMMALLAPAFNTIRGGSDIRKSAYDIAGILEQARTYALANNTYTWVGFYEEDGSKLSTNPATSGIGRVIVFAVASKDGTRYSDSAVDTTNPPAFGTESPTASPQRNQVQLIPLIKLMRLDNTHMAALNSGTNSGNIPARPGAPTKFGTATVSYQMGDAVGQSPDNDGSNSTNFAKHIIYNGSNPSLVKNPTAFQYPLASYGQTTTAQYKFAKIIEFNPQGEASKICENVYSGPGPQDAMEIAIQPAHGTAIDAHYTGNKAAAAIQIEGLTGRVRIYR